LVGSLTRSQSRSDARCKLLATSASFLFWAMALPIMRRSTRRPHSTGDGQPSHGCACAGAMRYQRPTDTGTNFWIRLPVSTSPV
jgi:hypothetical protein